MGGSLSLSFEMCFFFGTPLRGKRSKPSMMGSCMMIFVYLQYIFLRCGPPSAVSFVFARPHPIVQIDSPGRKSVMGTHNGQSLHNKTAGKNLQFLDPFKMGFHILKRSLIQFIWQAILWWNYCIYWHALPVGNFLTFFLLTRLAPGEVWGPTRKPNAWDKMHGFIITIIFSSHFKVQGHCKEFLFFLMFFFFFFLIKPLKVIAKKNAKKSGVVGTW